MKKLCTLVIALLLTISFQQTVSAQTSPSTDSAEVQDNLRERIRRANENQNQVRGTSTSGVKRGFIGTVKRISEETMTLETTRGTLVVTLEDLALVQNNRSITTEDIEIDNSAVILGYQSGDDFQPRRIIVSEDSLQPTAREIYIGSVTEVNRTSITITPRGSQDSKVFSWLPSNRSELLNKDKETIRLTDIETEQDVILISLPEDSNSQAVKDSAGRVKVLYSLANTVEAE